MRSADGAGEFDVEFEQLAGSAPGKLSQGKVAYITTGNRCDPALHTSMSVNPPAWLGSHPSALGTCDRCKVFILCAAGAPLPEGADAVVQVENTEELAANGSQRRVKIVKVCAHCR